MPKYKQFKVRHPEYDAGLWAKCRAFYAGGDKLLGDRMLLQSVFPKHLAERVQIYEERCKRAFYIPYAGEIINSICSGLFAEQLVLRSDPETAATDEFYEEFYDDVSPPGGRKQSLIELLKVQVLTALLCRRAWTLVDLPEGPQFEFEKPETAAAEEAMGLTEAYAVTIDPEMVLDWEEGGDGELEWALILHKHCKRDGIDGSRELVTEEYTFYSEEEWAKYAITYKKSEPPPDDTEVPETARGKHSFGRVPLVRLEVPDGMWAMGKILPIAIAHMNLRNALSWAEYKSLFPVLAAFKQGLDVTNPATEDPNRDAAATYGQGYVAGFAEKDRLEYVGPDPGPFTAALADLNNLRDEMHRVLHQMALSVDNSGAALQRSGESKQVDQQSASIILRALGQVVRDHVIEVLETVQVCRDEEPAEWRPEGMEKYDEVSVDGLLAQAETVDVVSIPSAKFKQLWTYNLARRLLGENANDDELEEIREELEENITNEQFTMADVAATAAIDKVTAETQAIASGEPEDDEEPPVPKAKKGVSFKSK